MSVIVECRACGKKNRVNERDSYENARCGSCRSKFQIKWMADCPSCGTRAVFWDWTHGKFAAHVAGEAIAIWRDPLEVVRFWSEIAASNNTPSWNDGACSWCGEYFLVCPHCKSMVHHPGSLSSTGWKSAVVCAHCSRSFRTV